ncbi:MAG: hypothetical protein GY855_05575 [candidate division Zixibacteria bacterium]|nr:hypothetical protein [candidate division Zixibacteria bacterium]
MKIFIQNKVNLNAQKGALLIEAMIGVLIIAIGSITLYTMFIHGQEMLRIEEHRFIAKNKLFSELDQTIMEYELNPTLGANDIRRTLYLIEDRKDPPKNIAAVLEMDMEELPGAEIQGGRIIYVYATISWTEKNGNDYQEVFLTSFSPAG